MKRASRFVMLLEFLLLAGCNKSQPSDDPAWGKHEPRVVETGNVIFPPDSPKLSQIRVETVQEAEVPTDVVIAPGKIEVNPNRVFHVLLPVSGRIAAVMVKLGDAVQEGQALLGIESPDADAAMSAYLQAEAAVTQAKAAHVKAQADFDRVSDLFSHNAIAKKEVLYAENALTQAQAAVEQAKAAREQTEGRLSILGLKPGHFGQKVVVRAPMPGKVLETNVAPGEYRNDTNAALMTIADLSTVWVASDVPENSIRFIQPGERVDIELTAYPGETFHGRVTRIADTVDPQTRTVKVRAEIDNSHGRLRPEMFGRIRHTEATRVLPVVPAGAVIQGDGQTSVFREVSPGVFQQTPVTVGNPVRDRIAIRGGIKAGERVVVDGVMLLRGH